MKIFLLCTTLAFVNVAVAEHPVPLVVGNGFVLTERDLQESLSSLSVTDRIRVGSNERMLRDYINSQYRTKALFQESIRQGLLEDKDVLRSIENARKKIAISALFVKVKNNIVVPDFDALARTHYEVEKESYLADETIRARHILLKAKSHDEKLVRIPEMKKILAELDSGVPFSKLAKLYSEDSVSAKKEGDLGQFSRGKMIREFEAAAFALSNEGQVSDIVETKYGLHIIQLISKQPVRQKTYDEVKYIIIAELQQDYINSEINSWRNEIVSPEKASVNVSSLDAFIKKTIAGSKLEAKEVQRQLDLVGADVN